MKSLSRCFLVLVIVFSMTLHGIQAMATYDGGFHITAHTEEELSTILRNLDAEILSEEPRKQRIKAFSLSEIGMFAVVVEDYIYRTICVYDQEGSFQYGYRIKADGEVGVEFCGEELFIYHTRSDILYSLDKKARVRELWNVEPTRENYNYAHYNPLGIFSEKKKIGSETYKLTNNSFLDKVAASFSKLIVTDASGNQRIVYDAGSAAPEMIHNAIGILIPVVGAIFGLVVLFGRRRK